MFTARTYRFAHEKPRSFTSRSRRFSRRFKTFQIALKTFQILRSPVCILKDISPLLRVKWTYLVEGEELSLLDKLFVLDKNLVTLIDRKATLLTIILEIFYLSEQK